MRFCSVAALIYSPALRRFTWQEFAGFLRAAHGGRRILLAFGFGALSALAFPPADGFPLLWLCLPALIFLVQGTRKIRQAFAAGWSFAFGFLVCDLYWIAAAMFVDIHHFWWAVPLAAIGLPILFAVYYGLAAALAYKIGTKGIAGAITFALCWFLADYARGHLFTGFPWDIAGYAWAGILPVAQFASVTGIYGLTLLTLVLSFLPAALACNRPHKYVLPSVLGGFLILALLTGWGAWRLGNASWATVPNVRLRLVQPRIDQAHKWQPDEAAANFQRLLKLSAAPAAQPVTDIIWPETAATYFLAEDGLHRRAASAIIPAAGSLLTGAIRRELDGQGTIHYFNSLLVINGKARVTAYYDKSHLVPFGEYMPLRQILPGHGIAAMALDFSHGPGPRTIHISGLPPFSPFICYEAIFPDEVVNRADPPLFMLNITNDGWYGNTAGPYQHFSIARMRAIEQGIPLVRVANTGISGVIDAYGRVRARLGLGKQGFIDSDLPRPSAAPTLFARYGENLLWVLFGLLTSGLILVRKRQRK